MHVKIQRERAPQQQNDAEKRAEMELPEGAHRSDCSCIEMNFAAA